MSLIKKTEGIRNYCVSLIIEHFTPSLYKKILPFIKNNWNNIPRPAILFMKEYFNRKFVIGAEIGVDKGKNAKSILKELNIKRLYLIDVWFNYKGIPSIRPQKDNFKLVSKEFKNNKKVSIIKDFSINAVNKIADNSLDFVYIDANHSFESIYQDIKLWFNKVKEGGVIAGHDIYSHEGVFEAIVMFCSKQHIEFEINIPDWYFLKRGNN